MRISMRVVLLILSALIFLVIAFTLDAGARSKRKQARLNIQHQHTQQSTHHKLRSVSSSRSAYAQAELWPNGEPPNPAPLAYGAMLTWDRYGLRWD